jgi:hypothetical protein
VHAANGHVKDLGFKFGRQWWAAKYSSNPAKFKFNDFNRETKQRADLAWSWAVQMVTGMSTLSSDWNIEDITAIYSSNPAKFRDLISEIKQRADLPWSWAVQMVIGTLTMSCDWNVEDVSAKSFHISIIDETTIVLLDSLAVPSSNGIEIKFLCEGLPTQWLTKGLPTWLILLINGIKFYCNQTDWITTTANKTRNTTILNSHDLQS